MSNKRLLNRYQLHILETPQALTAVEGLQRLVWPGNETEIVPSHLLLAAVHNGGLAIGAYDLGERSGTETEAPPEDIEWPADTDIPDNASLIGFVFGFPGLYFTPDGPRPKHCSHMLGVHPQHRDQGIGFVLKRAQWQMVRHQGLDRITWTYDPLLSRNAHLNITLLGAVCNTYIKEAYGEMRDGLNVGVPSDRFQVDWWINSQRVLRRLSKKPRRQLDLAHFLAAEAAIINPTQAGEDGLPRPSADAGLAMVAGPGSDAEKQPLLLLEIPADFMALKAAAPGLALEWRLHSRALFEEVFKRGYLVTDFIHLPGKYPRSFYVLSFGESTL